MTTAHARPRFFACRGQCAVADRHADHHDRLLTVDTDADALLELLEIAVTWHELDYSDSDLVRPTDWVTFADTHAWRYPDRAERAFSLAVDIAGRRAAGQTPVAQPSNVISLIR